jgi:exosome complex component RRP40
MEEEQAAEAADAFLKAAGRTMDVSFESCVTLPGDDLTARVSKGSSSIKLGPGLRQMGGQVIATKSGALRYKAPKTYWIESNQRRYVPRVEDHVR